MRSLPRSRWNLPDSGTGSRCAGQWFDSTVWWCPMRETVSTLMRHEEDVVPEGLYPYFQDVYDHILRVSESSDSLRDLVTAIVETNFSLRDYRQNLIVKKVSGWAAIIAVPALITGYYGMNVPYPGSGEVAGVIWSTLLIIGVSASLYYIFRHNDWL